MKSESEFSQSYPTLSDSMDYSLSGSSVHGILQASVLEWVAIAFSRIGVSSSLNFWENSAVKPSGPELLFAGRFLITVSISMLVMGLLRFSVSSWFSFGSCTCLRICPFLPRCPFYWHIVADNSLL